MEDLAHILHTSLVRACRASVASVASVACGLLAFVALVGCANDPIVAHTSKTAPVALVRASTEVESPVVAATTVNPPLLDPPVLPIPAQKPAPVPPRPLPVPPSLEPEVAIRIDTLSPSDSIVIDHPSGRVSILSESLSGEGEMWTASAPVEIRAIGSGWRVTPSRRSRPASSDAIDDVALKTRDIGEGELTIQAPHGNDQPIIWKGNSWPGKLRVVRTPEKIDLVMDVAMDTYLPGVIAKELYPSWCAAAYHAQAIAARSFALVEEARWEGRRHYDMVAGQQSQAWIGATKNAKAIDAVRETRGQVLVHDGVVVPAYYSSCCGGRPANALGVLTDNPHHDIAPISTGNSETPRGSCCEGTAVSKWKASISLATIRARLQEWGRTNGRTDLSDLQPPSSIAVADKNSAGRPTILVIRSRSGAEVTIDAEDFRRAINAAGDSKTSMRSSDCSIRIASGNVDFAGRGFGHGVGLCQHGAQEMGRKGSSYRQILTRYYPETMIVQAWK